MNDHPSDNLSGLDIDLARRIDEVCRRFEADWREGRQPRIEDYLVDVADEGRPALRAELEALECELRRSDQTVARPEAGPPTPQGPRPAPKPSTIALAVGGATAPTLAMVSRGESFDLRGGVAAIEPSPQPSPRGEGASGDENPSL